MTARSFLLALVAAATGLLASPLWAQEQAPSGWVAQEASTPRFRFEVLATTVKDRSGAKSIRIIDRASGAAVQDLAVDGDPTYGGAARLVRIVDANFDGHPDLPVVLSDGGAGPNSSHAFYLFDPALDRFVFNAFLSELPQPYVGTDGTIQSASRGGCCQHDYNTYRYLGGRYVLVASVEETLSTDGKWLHTSTCKLRRGKMRCINKRTRQPREPG